VKSALTDFYSDSEIQGAKERLLSDANELKLTAYSLQLKLTTADDHRDVKTACFRQRGVG